MSMINGREMQIYSLKALTYSVYKFETLVTTLSKAVYYL